MAKWANVEDETPVVAPPAPPPVLSYTTQTNDNVAAVNINKVLEEVALRRIDELALNPDCDQRWVNIARTHLQEGFMALNRAIFKPQRIEGPLDFEAVGPVCK